MITYDTELKRFDSQGEKTGWTYIEVPTELAAQLKPGVRTSYRVKGKLDAHPIAGVALIPMGEGSFILAVNAAMRKAIRKVQGATVRVRLAVDTEETALPPAFEECLRDEPAAHDYFYSLTPGHQRYFGRWIGEAKTEATLSKRIAMAVDALARGWGYPEMIRAAKAKKEKEGL
ncbi:YdeI/OmpD-associated family protein [Flaviaesturariibacter amylovorans]|uniref:DUF1905 domain-containing protein n=1 Tax=Flaviaesturariibacter amylovorans TaxID=1084520 RepID=A0ABP8GGJ6_9BACT